MKSEKEIQISNINDFINQYLDKAVKKAEKCKDIKEFKIPFARPERVITYLEKNGFDEYEQLDTNGWQWDYWLSYIKNDRVYCISGDGYYQDYCTIYFDKEATERYLSEIMDEALE